MTIRKGIVVSFLPCLVAFWGFHLYMFFHFLRCFFLLLIDSNTIRIAIYKVCTKMGKKKNKNELV